jgi:SH3 domain-containing protein
MDGKFLTIIKTGAGLEPFSAYWGSNGFGPGKVMIRGLLAFAIGLGLIFSAVNVGARQATPEATTIYTITSSQNVNARSCPRLTCSIVTTLAPGQEFSVIETTDGDAVSDNRQWYHAIVNDADVYVHSSLAAPRSAPADETNAWSEYSGPGFTISAPPTWINLADDPKAISQALDLAAQSDPQVKDMIDAFREQLESGLVDVLLFDPLTASNVIVLHQDTGFSIPLSFVEKTVSDQLEAAGGKVLETEYVQISAGEALRIHVQAQPGSGLIFEQYDYVFAASDRLYFIAVTADRALFESASPLFEQIVNSFTIAARA